MRHFILASAALLSVALVFNAAGQEAERTAEDAARELLEVLGAGTMGIQILDQMIGSFKTSVPDVPEEFWDEILASADPDHLVDMIIPIYVKHLSLEDMEAALEFYKTQAGQTIVRKLPLITQESMMVGQEWGMQMANEVQTRLQERGQNED